MIKKICRIFFLILFFMAFIGCSNIIETPKIGVTLTPLTNPMWFSTSSTTSDVVTGIPTAINNKIVSPTSTELIRYESTSPIIKEVCPASEKYLPSNNITDGKMLFVDYETNRIMSLDFETSATELFVDKDEKVLSYALSYNGETLAYQAENNSTHEQRLIVVGANREKRVSIPWGQQWIKISYWLDNEHLVIKSYKDSFFELLILDPFTNEQKGLSINLPNIYTFDYPPDWNGAGPAIFNSDLTRVIYADSNQNYIMWDVKKNVPYVSIQSFLIQQPSGAPQWSMDGSQAIIAAPLMTLDFANYELFSIDETGGITRLTYLTDLYATVGIERYSWSPDGMKIAMLISTESKETNKSISQQLAILNRSKNVFELYCFQGDTTLKPRMNSQGDYDPILYTGVAWSPDSTQVLLENRHAENSSNIILLDTDQMTAHLLIENANVEPIGWLINKH